MIDNTNTKRIQIEQAMRICMYVKGAETNEVIYG